MFDLKQIRQDLHEQPELSGEEENTSKKIKDYLKSCDPDELVNIGNYGIVAVFDTGKSGPNVLFRCELDGLPIREDNSFPYVSKNPGVAHSCGHDGHMTIMLGVAEKISSLKERFRGKIYLLFQPAEETAEGAKVVAGSSFFRSIDLDYVFGLHNLPGFQESSVIIRKDVFAATSKGLIVRLKGKSSHAGEPQNGNNPVFAMTEIVKGLEDIYQKTRSEEDLSLITIIHMKLGDVAFGTNPGEGVVMATFRSTSEGKMDYMSKEALSLVHKTSSDNDLRYEVEWVEVFPILNNDDKCVEIVQRSAEKNGLKIVNVDKPFSWTEDFSYYTQKYKGAFFGLGAGVDHPQLHNSDYDFPDEIVEGGIDVFVGILCEISKLEGA